MVNFTILAGGSASFIVSYLFNSDTSTLSVRGQFPTGENPSWIALHPTEKAVLYATNEIEQGALQSFSIDPSGALSPPIDTVSSGGNGPAFAMPMCSGQVAVMNFGGGNGVVIPTTNSLQFDRSATPITFPVPKGAKASNPHAAYEFNNEILVPDLGADTVWRLVEDGAPGKWKIAGSIDQPKGSGPRHAVVQNNTLFTLHEIDNTLTAQSIPASPSGTPQTFALATSIAPTDAAVPAGAKYAAAEVLMPAPAPGFEPGLLYASNRNVGNPDVARGDSIAIVRVVTALPAQQPALRVVKQVFTGLQQIRSMAFSDDGQFLVAGGAKDGGVKVFRRTEGGLGLEEVASNREVSTRTSFVWLDGRTG